MVRNPCCSTIVFAQKILSFDAMLVEVVYESFLIFAFANENDDIATEANAKNMKDK